MLHADAAVILLAAAGVAVAGLAVAASRLARKAAEIARQARRVVVERDRYASVLEGMNAAVFAIDAELRLTALNAAMRDMFELKGELLGEDFREVVPVEKVHDCVEEALEGRSVRVEIELPGEGRRHGVAYASPIGGRGGRGGVAVVLRDVSAIRHLERVRRDFVANVSHELRTPVSVIQASAETLLAGALSEPEHARSFAQAIERHASRLTRIIAGLLDLARLEAGQRGMARERVNVRSATLRAVDLVAEKAAERGVEITVNVPREVYVVADAKGLDQVLSNLLENGVKYGKRKGRIGVSSVVHNGWVRIDVADNGPGIKAKHRQRVFERFYRVDKGRSREQGGTGLGLAIVKHLTLAMGGTVGVEPREPKGSVFWVRLPNGSELPTHEQ